jgi:hypothetical protein
MTGTSNFKVPKSSTIDNRRDESPLPKFVNHVSQNIKLAPKIGVIRDLHLFVSN